MRPRLAGFDIDDRELGHIEHRANLLIFCTRSIRFNSKEGGYYAISSNDG